MTGLKTNERPGTRAVLRHYLMSPTKARQVLDLIRDKDVQLANEILRTTEREAAAVVGKLLASAVANAVHNDGMDAEDLYVSACFADEAGQLKRWRPRARGRATRIRKRQCHITVIVSRLPDERLQRRRAEREELGGQRSRRVAESRRRADLSGRLSRRRSAQEAAAEAEAAGANEDTGEDIEAEDMVTDESTAALDATAADGDAGDSDTASDVEASDTAAGDGDEGATEETAAAADAEDDGPPAGADEEKGE
jgi:large subunit ribosomal protein L22